MEDLLVAEIKVYVGCGVSIWIHSYLVLMLGLKGRMCLSYEKKTAGWRLVCALFFVQEFWSFWLGFVFFFICYVG